MYLPLCHIVLTPHGPSLLPHGASKTEGTRVYPPLEGCTSPIPHPHGASLSPYGPSKSKGTRVYPPLEDCVIYTNSPWDVPIPAWLFQDRGAADVSTSRGLCTTHTTPMGRPHPHTVPSRRRGLGVSTTGSIGGSAVASLPADLSRAWNWGRNFAPAPPCPMLSLLLCPLLVPSPRL